MSQEYELQFNWTDLDELLESIRDKRREETASQLDWDKYTPASEEEYEPIHWYETMLGVAAISVLSFLFGLTFALVVL